jgi:hypothetical protein
MNNMAKQMEMFETGGLMDEGGTVDPVSGNDVPPGSTQEEVRDDIPAQLSEGEFVFPADVVRFIGLERLMMIRQRAKAGLKRMEEMGQMGNSEEAIMPDDLPFSIDDLDMEDDGLEMAQGGVVHMANGGSTGSGQGFVSIPPGIPTPQQQLSGVFYNPAAQSTTGVAAAPTKAASASVGQAATPIKAASAGEPTAFTNYKLPQAPVPVMTAPSELPSFLGGTVPGVGGVEYTEETYVNEAGDIIKFRRYNDGSLKDSSGNEAVIPEGYKIKSEAEETVTTDPTTVATVQDYADDGGDNKEPTTATVTLGGQSGTGRQKGLRVGNYKTFGVSYDVPGGLPGVVSAVKTVAGLAFGKGLPAGATATIFDRDFPNASVTVPAAEFNAMKAAGWKGELADMYKDSLSITADVLDNKVNIQDGKIVDAQGNAISDKAQGIVQKAVVGSVLSNVKTAVPGLLGSINNIGKVSFEEAVANANDAQKAVLDNMGVDYDTSLDLTAAEKADLARQEEKAMADAIAAANKARADKARAEAAKREEENRARAAEIAARYNDNSRDGGGGDSGERAGDDASAGGVGVDDTGTSTGYGSEEDCLTEDMKVKLNGVVDFVTNVKVGDIIDNYRVKEVLHKHMRSGYYAINNELKISNDHPVLANGTWTRPEDLVVGDSINGIPVTSLEYVERMTPTVSIVIDGESFDVHTENNIYTVHGRYREVRQEAA